MKKIIALALVMAVTILTMVGCVAVRAEGDLKTPLEWAREEIASDERYEGQHVMWAVIPIEDSSLGENEALYFIIAITEESDLVMDWYGVHLEWEEYKPSFKESLGRIYSTKPIIERFSREDVYIDADLAKTEVIE